MINEEKIRKVWSSNSFMNTLGITIESVGEGEAVLKMPIDFSVHTNHWLGVHGGALAALADAVTGILCASVGKIAQTMNMNIDYISNLRLDGTAFIYGKIKHLGKSTIVINSEIRDDKDNLLCSISNIMFISGDFNDII